VLRDDGTLAPTTRNELRTQAPRPDAAEKSRDYVRLHWKYSEPGTAKADSRCDLEASCSMDSFEAFLDRIQSYSLCISGMAFQDAWNIDLDRLQRCCVHVATPQKTLVPFCSYYLTDSHGRRLIDAAAAGLLK
jgi:7,8-dihydro-6-hydroxymethylpterin dimethyltransferase